SLMTPELCGRPGLALKSLEERRRRQVAGMWNLESDNAVELRVASTPHGTECPPPYALEKLKPPEQANFVHRGDRLEAFDPERAAALVAKELIACLAIERDRLVALGAAKNEVALGWIVRVARASFQRIRDWLRIGVRAWPHANVPRMLIK